MTDEETLQRIHDMECFYRYQRDKLYEKGTEKGVTLTDCEGNLMYDYAYALGMTRGIARAMRLMCCDEFNKYQYIQCQLNGRYNGHDKEGE